MSFSCLNHLLTDIDPFVDWVQDKIRSGFAFEAICWERNFIPKIIWQTGDSTTNVEEALHANVNLDGILCTAIGGITKGRHFDTMKDNSLRVSVYIISCTYGDDLQAHAIVRSSKQVVLRLRMPRVLFLCQLHVT